MSLLDYILGIFDYRVIVPTITLPRCVGVE